MLEDILCCPVCHKELPLRQMSISGNGACSSCGRMYTCENGVYCLIPIPPPDQDVQYTWALWEKLQENGLTAYKLVPEASCSVTGRSDVIMWKEFLKLKPRSRILDVGCGPVGMPDYLKGWENLEVVGIDPLKPLAAFPDMSYVVGIGEYLPFNDASFDSIIMATSLDHVLSLQRVVSELKRCVREQGNILLWIAPDQKDGLVNKMRALAGRSIAAVSKLLVKPNKKSSDKPLWMQVRDSLGVPSGAIDPFHMRHDDEKNLEETIKRLGFYITRRRTYSRESVFMELRLHG